MSPEHCYIKKKKKSCAAACDLDCYWRVCGSPTHSSETKGGSIAGLYNVDPGVTGGGVPARAANIARISGAQVVPPVCPREDM